MIFLIYHWIMFLFIVCRWWLFKWHFCGWIEIYAAQRWREMFRGQGGDLVTTTALIILLDCWMVKRNIAYVSYVFSIPAYGIFTMYGTVQEFWTVKSSSCNSQVRQDDARQVARQVAGWLYFFCHVNPWRCLFRRNPWSASQWCWRRLHFECSTGKACEDVVDVLMDTINHWPTWIHTFHWHHPTSNITKTFCWDLWRLQRKVKAKKLDDTSGGYCFGTSQFCATTDKSTWSLAEDFGVSGIIWWVPSIMYCWTKNWRQQKVEFPKLLVFVPL